MNLQKKVFFYTGLPVFAFSLLFASHASAHGNNSDKNFKHRSEFKQIKPRPERFEEQAKLLGITVDEYKNLSAQGLNFKGIAEHLGISPDSISQKRLALKQEKIKFRLSNLVSKGVITQDQADQRLQNLKVKLSEKNLSK